MKLIFAFYYGKIFTKMVKTLAVTLFEARHAAGLTQAQVAKNAGINTNAYAKIERGESKSRPVTLKKIAKALNLNIAMLIEAIEE